MPLKRKLEIIGQIILALLAAPILLAGILLQVDMIDRALRQQKIEITGTSETIGL